MAAKGIAQGNILFRGERVVVKDVKQLAARKPYDAPNWVRTDRPITFAELKTSGRAVTVQWRGFCGN